MMRTDIRRALTVFIPLVLVAATVSCGFVHRSRLSLTQRVVRNTSESMLPNISAGDYLAIDETYYSHSAVRRFDLVVVKSPRLSADEAPDPLVVKRVIGLGGERLKINHGHIFIDGNELIEPITVVAADPSEDFEEFSIPLNQFFVMGDNRPNSEDSRHWINHSVPLTAVTAKVTEIIKNRSN